MFTVSAPGKIILFGEHAVVYGCPAIATSVSLRTYITVEPSHAATNLIELRLPDLKMELDVTAADLAGIGAFSGPVPSKLDPKLLAEVEEAAEKLVPGCSPLKLAAIVAFIYLYVCVYRSVSSEPRRFTVRSDLPLGAGLGSSASLSVALAAALLRAAGKITPRIDSVESREKTHELVTQWSFIGECCIHGNPSGLDNLVATRGGAVRFTRNPSGAPTVTPLADVPKMGLLITDTKVSRSTNDLVARVRKFAENWPELFDKLMQSFTELVDSAHSVLESTNSAKNQDTQVGQVDQVDQVGRLCELIELNHGLLATLAVSHPALERVREAGKASRVGSTKLTGAGGGGCAITVISSDSGETEIAEFKTQLGDEFAVFTTDIGGEGVGFADGIADSVEEMKNLPWEY